MFLCCYLFAKFLHFSEMVVGITGAVGYFGASENLIGAAVSEIIPEIRENPQKEILQSRSKRHPFTALSPIEWKIDAVRRRCVDITDNRCLSKCLIYFEFDFFMWVQEIWAPRKVVMAVKLAVQRGVWDGVGFREKIWGSAANARHEGVYMILFMAFAAISAGSLP